VIEDQEKTGTGRKIIQLLIKTRGRFGAVLGEFFGEPHASLLMGIIFGIKSQMSQEFWERLRETGTLHIVVASGQNVAMVAHLILSGLVWLVSRRKAVALTAVGVLAYIFMAGAEPPLVRAGLMALLAYCGQVFGRQSEGSIALIIAAVVMLLASPAVVFDVGFWLSFAATAGILWIYPLVKPRQKTGWLFIQEPLATTIAAQLGVLPLLWLFFGQVSLFSAIVNALVLWVVPLLMILGLLTALLGIVIKPPALILSWFVWLLASYFIAVVNFFGQWSWLTFELDKISILGVVGYYLLLGMIIFKANHARSQPT
jgi:competence protein ComEC